jgi:hypothetical protein
MLLSFIIKTTELTRNFKAGQSSARSYKTGNNITGRNTLRRGTCRRNTQILASKISKISSTKQEDLLQLIRVMSVEITLVKMNNLFI